MLALFRAFAKSWIAKILFVVLIISFGLFFGINDMIKGPVSNAVIQTSGRNVTASEFKQKFDQLKPELEQQNGGQPVPPEMIVAAHIPEQFANSYAGQVAFSEWMNRVGIKPSEKLLGDQLAKEQAFLNPVTGAFDKARYLEALHRANVTPDLVEGELRNSIAERHLQIGFSSGIRLPRIYGAFLATLAMQTRDASWFVVNEKIAGAAPTPTDAQLQQYLALNASRYRRPDMRAGTVVLFSPELLAKDIKLTDAELKDAYAAALKDPVTGPKLAQPELRTFVQIATPGGQGQAQNIASAIKAGGDPASVASAAKLSAVTYADKVQRQLPYPKIAAAVFAMKPGDVTAMPGDVGWTVVRLQSVTLPKTVPFEQVRGQLEQRLRQDRAKGQVDDLASQYEAQRAKGVPMADAAKSLHLPVFAIPATSATGAGVDGKPTMLGSVPAPEDVIKSLFTLPKGAQSEVEQAGDSYFALHVDEVIPSAMPPLATVKDQLVKEWRTEEVRKLLHAKADELAQRVRKGESIQAVAASVGAAPQTMKDFRRPQRPPNQQAMQAMLAQHPELLEMTAAFSGSAGEVVVPPVADGFAVVRVEAVHSPEPAVVGGMVEHARPQLSMQQAEALYGSAHEQTRTVMKVKVLKDRLNAALGLPDDKALKGAAKGKAASK